MLLEDLDQAISEELTGLQGEYARRVLQDQNRSLPVNQLPVEVLSEIFVYAYSSADLVLFNDDLMFAAKNAHANRLAICGSCSLWRGIAIATPALWCHIIVTGTAADRYSYAPSMAPSLQQLQIELERAKKRLLDLTVYSSFSGNISEIIEMPNWTPYLELLSPQLSRCRTLNIISYNNIIGTLIQTNPPSTLPNLERLRLDTRDLINEDIHDFSCFPCLQHLTFQYSWGPLRFCDSQSIKALRLCAEVPFESAVGILAECPNVRCLHWESWSFPEEFSGSQIDLLALHQLVIIGSSVTPLSQRQPMVQFINAPELQQLLCLDNFPHNNQFPMLRYLSFVWMVNEERLTAWFHHHPSVEVVALPREQRLSRKLVDCLIRRLDHDKSLAVLPNLRRIIFHSFEQEDEVQIEELILARPNGLFLALFDRSWPDEFRERHSRAVGGETREDRDLRCGVSDLDGYIW